MRALVFLFMFLSCSPVKAQSDITQSIQDALDIASDPATLNKTVRLPIGNVNITRPLWIKGQNVRLTGSEEGPTNLYGNFAGHLIVARKPTDFSSEFTPSLINNVGSSLRTRPNKPGGFFVATEPGLVMKGLTEFSIRYFFRRIAIPNPNSFGYHAFFGGNYGHRKLAPLIIGDWNGGLTVQWGTNKFDIPAVSQEIDKTYYLALTFKAGILKVYLGEPGAQAVLIKEWTAPSQTVPFIGGGVEIFSMGQDVNGPLGDMAAWNGSDTIFDNVEIADICRHNEPFICPTTDFIPDARTRFFTTFELSFPFVKGYGKDGRVSWVMPSLPEVHIGGNKIENITFMSGSGPCLCDSIQSTFKNLNMVQTFTGYTIRGTTFRGTFENLSGGSHSFAWIQGVQSMQTIATGISLNSHSAGAITCYLHGAVGGSYRGLYLTPHAPVFASLYIYGTYDVNIDTGQVDDERQAGNVDGVVMISSAWVKMNGMLLTKAFAGPIIDCSNGGSCHLSGTWLLSQEGNEPQIKFHYTTPPNIPFTMVGCGQNPPTIPVTNRIELINAPLQQLKQQKSPLPKK